MTNDVKNKIKNNIANIEGKITSLEYESYYYYKKTKNGFTPKAFFLCIAFPIILPILNFTLSASYGFGGIFENYSIFINLLKQIAMLISLSIPIATATLLIEKSIYNHNKKEEKAINYELQFLKNELKIENELLHNNDNTKKMETTKTVQDTSELEVKDIEEYLELFHLMGYDYDKLYKLYKSGKLDNYLNKYYDDVASDFIQSHFNEKEKRLIKKL